MFFVSIGPNFKVFIKSLKREENKTRSAGSRLRFRRYFSCYFMKSSIRNEHLLQIIHFFPLAKPFLQVFSPASKWVFLLENTRWKNRGNDSTGTGGEVLMGVHTGYNTMFSHAGDTLGVTKKSSAVPPISRDVLAP